MSEFDMRLLLEKKQEEIERLTENNLSMQGEMARTWKKAEEKDREIERLTCESTKWESKFYDEAKKVDKVREYIENPRHEMSVNTYQGILEILDEVDKEQE